MCTFYILEKHLLCCADVDEWSLRGGGLRTVADPQLRIHGLSQLLHEWVMDPTLNQKAVGADTGLRQRQVQDIVSILYTFIALYCNILEFNFCIINYNDFFDSKDKIQLIILVILIWKNTHLARVPEFGGHRPRHSFVYISAVEYNEGGVTPQLHGHPFDSSRCMFKQNL